MAQAVIPTSSYPPPVLGRPRPHQPTMNAWNNGNDSSNNSHRNLIKQKQKAKSTRSPCNRCLAVGLPLALLVILGGLIGGAVAAGLRSRTTAPPTTVTTTTTTTGVPLVCNSSCSNQSWTSSSNLLAEWSFDGTLNDLTNNFNAISNNNPLFITNGYINQALSFNATANQSLYTSFIPLTNTSFTIEAWLYPTGYPNIKDHSIIGLCFSRTTSMCLHFTIRNTSSSYRLYMGFLNNDCASAQNITLNKWIHAAFVFDLTTMYQWIYINGVVNQRCTAVAPIMVTTGNVTIGTIPVLAGTTDINTFQGYMDKLTISQRAKPACEILERVTLAARFPFNRGSILDDYGPNTVSSRASSYSIISNGHSLQAISFNGSSSSYFQASGFTSFNINNQPFSISLWIQPLSLSGTLVHISTSSNGAGSWCNSLLGFSSSGTLVAQIYDGSIRSVTALSLLSLGPYWTYVVQTWSPTNGLRLYVNSALVASLSSANTFVATGTTTNYVTLANGLMAAGNCAAGALGVISPFQGAVDDFTIYSRELTSADICGLYSR